MCIHKISAWNVNLEYNLLQYVLRHARAPKIALATFPAEIQLMSVVVNH